MNPRTANFEALYADCDGMAVSPNTLEMLTTCPSPAAFRCGRKAIVPCTTPQKLMPMSHRRSS